MKRNLILLLYSWLVYNVWIFILAPFYIEDYGLWAYVIYIFFILSAYYDFSILFNSLEIFFTEYAIIPLYFFFASGITLYFWWKKQTIVRAWLLALAGMVAGPGLIFGIFPRMRYGPPEIPGFYGLLALNLIFFILLLANFLQKRFWPNNKLASKLRSILKWPCLRT